MTSLTTNISGRELLYQAYQANPTTVGKAADKCIQVLVNTRITFHVLLTSPHERGELPKGDGVQCTPAEHYALERRKLMLKNILEIINEDVIPNASNETLTKIGALFEHKFGSENETTEFVHQQGFGSWNDPHPRLTKFLERLSAGTLSSPEKKQEKTAKREEAAGKKYNAEIDRKIEALQPKLKDLQSRLEKVGERGYEPLSYYSKKAGMTLYETAKEKVRSPVSLNLLEDFKKVCEFNGKS